MKIRFSSLGFALFLVYTMACWIYDCVTFIFHRLGLDPGTPFLWMPIALLLFLAYRTIRHYFEIDKTSGQNHLLIPVIIIVLMTLFKLPLPDSSFDVLNYHLFLQKPAFEDHIADSFFPCGIWTFISPLADHLFYPFRVLLGFRLGTVFNTLVLILVLHQCYVLIKAVFRLYEIKLSEVLVAWLALGVVVTEYVILNLSTYLVDLVHVPILLEAVILLLEDRTKPPKLYLYIGGLCGLAIALKLTTLAFIVPILICLIVLDCRKQFWLFWIAGCLAVSAASLPYLWHNYTQTANPIFPFYNAIFKSSFFPLINFHDDRFGPETLVQTLAWPLYVFIHPQRLGEITSAYGVYSGRISLGFLIVIGAGIHAIASRFKQNKRRGVLMGLMFALSMVLWSHMAGYIRYAHFLEVISGIIAVAFIAWCLRFGNKWHRFLGFALGAAFAFQMAMALGLVYICNIDHSWRPSPLRNPKTYLRNCAMLGRDYAPYAPEASLAPVEAWMSTDFNASYLRLLKDHVPIFDIKLMFIGDEPATREAWNRFRNKNLSGKRIFSAATPSAFPTIAQKLQLKGYGIRNETTIEPEFLQVGEKLVLFEVVERGQP